MINISHILCPVDFSEFSRRALDHAIAMAKWYEARLTMLHVFALGIAQEANARLTIMHAIEVPPELAEDPLSPGFNVDAIHAAARAARLQRLHELIPESARTYCTVETTVREGAAYRQILTVAAEQHSDLIVMGVHGRGAIDLLVFGSNTIRVTRAATCPVLTVRQ